MTYFCSKLAAKKLQIVFVLLNSNRWWNGEFPLDDSENESQSSKLWVLNDISSDVFHILVFDKLQIKISFLVSLVFFQSVDIINQS